MVWPRKSCISSFAPDAQNTRIIVMYHYIENRRKDRGGMHPCTPEEFETQLVFLSRHYRIASLEEVCKSSANTTMERLCALTFDDGTKDHFTNAVLLLEKYNAQATFFIITKTFDFFVPFTHKIHLLLSVMSAYELRDRFHFFLDSFFPEWRVRYHIPTDAYINPERSYADIVETNVKDTLVLLPLTTRMQFLDWLFADLALDERELASGLFMNESEVCELAARGFSIGNHTHNHESLDCITAEEIRQEIITSQKRLNDILEKPATSFCYPYGRSGKNRNKILAILKKQGFTHGVVIENRSLETTDKPLLLPRYRMNSIRDYITQHNS